MKKRVKTDLKIAAAAVFTALSLLLSACIFGGQGGGTQPAQDETSAPAETATKEAGQPTQAVTEAQTTTEAPPAPVTPEMVAEDLTEAFAALTGAEGAVNAHLLGAGDEPLEDFSYQGGAAIAAKYIKIQTKSVSGQGDTAQAVLAITSPDLLPLIEKAVTGMESMDEEAMNENLAALLKAGDYAKTEYEVTVALRNIGGVWYIEQNEDLQNALAGGLFAWEKAAAPTAGGKN